jgi:transposase-like protein
VAAVDQDGDVLDILVQSRRDKKSAKKFFRKLLKGLRYIPRVIITDKLQSHSSARAEVIPSVEHLQRYCQVNCPKRQSARSCGILHGCVSSLFIIVIAFPLRSSVIASGPTFASL